MDSKQVINAWADPVARLSMSTEQLAEMPAHPAGAIAQELSEDELPTSMGGQCGCGNICTVTGDCTCTNGFTQCWPWWC